MIYVRALFISLFVAGGVLLFAAWAQASGGILLTTPANSLIALSRLAGLLGGYMLIIQFLLISRAPWLEVGIGFDRLTRLHHWNGIIAFSLIFTHVLFVVGGHSLLVNAFPWLLLEYRFVPLAVAGFLMLVITVVLSATIVQKGLRYEVWYGIHLINYLIIGLVVWHQIHNGLTLLSHEWLIRGWIGLHIAVIANLIIYRFLRPVWLGMKHRFEVVRVEREASDTVSIYVSGRKLEGLKYEAGQFAKWRFLEKGLWSEEHPFTISREPDGRQLRLTPKAIGDYTRELQSIKPGTKVVVSGPLGAFTLKRTSNRKVLLVAGGIGITPLRAILGSKEAESRDIVLIYSARTSGDFVFRFELDRLAAEGGHAIKYILSQEAAVGYEQGRIDTERLLRLVPDVATRDVFICGPSSMMEAVAEIVHSQGVERSAIHIERFSL